MKTKKYVIAIALFGGMLFTAYAAANVNSNEQQTAKVDKNTIKVPTHG